MKSWNLSTLALSLQTEISEEREGERQTKSQWSV